MSNFIKVFAADESGAQVVEYALIIAVVSIALVIILKGLTTNGGFASFIARVSTCLAPGTTGTGNNTTTAVCA